MNADELANLIVDQRMAEISTRIQSYPRRNIIMSDLHECSRYLTYSVLDWQKRPAVTPELKARFEVGNVMEREVIRELTTIGFRVVLEQQSVDVKDKAGRVIASGRVDGFLELGERQRVPFEVKSMDPRVFDMIDSLEDLNRKPYLRRYQYQLQMYMYGNNVEQGLLILTNCLGAWTVLPVYLDYGLCEMVLKRIERSTDLIARKEYGDRIPYDPQQCDRCPFIVECLPDQIGNETEIPDRPDLIEMADRRGELKKARDEFERIDEHLKAITKKYGKDLILGNWRASLKTVERPVFVKTDEKKPTVQVTIKEIGNGKA